MATIIDLGKLRFHFAGDWSVATEYEINDIVKYGGNVYVYSNVVRTSGNLPTDPAYWALMVEGFKFREEWDTNTQYRVGDGVAHGGVVYIAIADSQGQTPPNPTYWSQFADGIQWEGEFDPARLYQANDIVKYGAQVYIAKQDTSGNLPTQITYWEQFVSGISAEGVYNAATAYVPGDLVAYGANIYRCTAESTGNLPTDPTYFELYNVGIDYQGEWQSVNNYRVGQTVRYGGNTYRALSDNTNLAPDLNPGTWEIVQTGVNSRGTWTTATYYAINDLVNHGGNTYQCLISHTAGVFDTDLAGPPPKWQKFNSGVRYMGSWVSGTTYLKDDIVSESVSTYIATQDHTAGSDFFIDNGNGLWDSFVVGASYVLPNTAGNAGKYLQTPDGVNYSWEFSGANDKIFYVSEDSTSSADDPDHGQAIDYAFASLRYACDYINADVLNRTPATIFIKDGTYLEQLPIHIPPNTTIVGDGQRNCIIEPDTVNDNGFGVGISDDGVTPNAETTMFFVNTGTMIEGILCRGLTGFQLGTTTPTDPEDATVKGVYFRLEPNAVILKSPYIKESSAFSTGGVGAIIDGSVTGAASNPGSMVFHTFTQVHDGGIGFWIKDNGLSEIVSCFTYYCDMGYVASGGGKIRSLNGNNSYGTYGCISTGFDTTEVPVNGYMYGDTVTYDPATLATSEGFTVGDIITGAAKTGSRVASSISIAQEAAITTQLDAAVTGVTQANPASVTATAHGFETGQSISFASVGGMVELNGNSYTITVVDANTFTLDGTDSSAFTAYTTGGTATLGGPHGLSEGDKVHFSNVGEPAWSALLGDFAAGDKRTWYADVVDATSFKLCTNYDLTNYFDTRSEAGWGFVTENITDATRSNPVILTFGAGHGYANGQLVQAITGVGGMTELNGNDYYAANVTATTLELYNDAGLTSSVDGTGFGAYTSGGSATRILNGTTMTQCDFGVADSPEADIANIQTNLVVNHRLVVNNTRMGVAGQTLKVNVGPPEYLGTGNRYYFNNWIDLAFDVYEERQYIFEQNDATNAGHPMYLATASGDSNGANEFTTGVSYYLDGVAQPDLGTYVAGFDAATSRELRFKIPNGQAGLNTNIFFACYNHANMGNGQMYLQAANATALERHIGGHPTFYVFPDTSTITAQDAQSATVAGDANLGQFGFSLVLGGLDEEPRAGGSIQFTSGQTYNPVDNTDYTDDVNYGVDTNSFIITTVSGYVPSVDPRIGGTAVLTLSQEKQNTAPSFYGQHFNIRYNYSQVRLTGHDFLSIGTGGRTTTNYPGEPTQAAAQGNEVTETLPGRVYYASTDQDGNFRVGNFFRIDQATGRATLDASAFDLSGLTSLRLGSIGAQLGESINEFSADGLLSGNSNTAVPTEQAVKTYVDTEIGTVNTTINTKVPLTTRGDVLTVDASGNNKRLPIGAEGTSLLADANGDVYWGTSSGYYAFELVTADVNPAVKSTGYLVDTSTAEINITLPASPDAGDAIFIHDYTANADNNPIHVLSNGSKIQGIADDMDIDYHSTALELVYTDADRGWQILNLI